MLTYLTRRQGAGLGQQLEKQIQEKCDCWKYVLRRVITVICTLAERKLAFRGADERFGSLQNGNFLGLLELISQFDPFLARHLFHLYSISIFILLTRRKATEALIHRVGNYPNLLPEIPRYCCPLVI